MKTIKIESLANEVEDLVRATGKERVLLTRQGKPFAMVSDASNLDAEDLAYINDPGFWEMIAKRRREPTVPFEEVQARLGIRSKRRATRVSAARGKTKRQ